MLATSTHFINGGIQLAAAVATADISSVYDALTSLKTSTADVLLKQPTQWYSCVRVLEELGPDTLIDVLQQWDGQRQPPNVSLFVVEILDAIARARGPTEVGAHTGHCQR